MTVSEYRKLRKGSRRKSPRVSMGKKWSSPEKRYFYGVIGGVGEYEPEHLRITPQYAEKHVYTPDFLTHVGTSGCIPVYHEVKGTYRLKSQDSARIRFVIASAVNDCAFFVWAKERKDRLWDIEVFLRGFCKWQGKGVRGFHFDSNLEVVWHGRTRQ